MRTFDVICRRHLYDILVLGHDFEKTRASLYASLTEKGLKVNPRKVLPVDTNTPFTFLGFQIHGERITFSKHSPSRFKKKVHAHTKTGKGQPLMCDGKLRPIILFKKYKHKWIDSLTNCKKPIKSTTLCGYESYFRTHFLPEFGGMDM